MREGKRQLLFSRIVRGPFWLALALFSACFLFSTIASAQTLTTGAITGTVTDQTGAVVPNATVTATNIETGAIRVVTTSSVGSYEITLLLPSNYRVKAEAKGFRATERGPIGVAISQAAIVNISLEVGSSTQTVEVTGGAPLVTTNPSIDTPYTTMEVQELPSAGGDLTNIAETAPGTVMNSMGGYGNFTTYGLPATSNLFTVNGENDMDPYFNINNSGASNLTIGGNEIQEATVTSNAYAGQYGQLAGAQVTMITKSGTNQYHGNAQWWWNGRSMNANDWMNNNTTPITPRPFSNANQWAASVGGPIRKDSTFFFVDTEGLRFLLPNEWTTTAPTAQFAQAVQANVNTLDPNESAAYTKMFQLYANAPGASTAVVKPNTSYCTGLSLPGFNPATEYCADTFRGSASSLGSEWILAARVDQKVGKSDNVYVRYKLDHGLQPTAISHINAAFNALSNQPAYDAQLNETHVFGAGATNSLMLTGSHYVAQFQQNEALALSTFPYAIVTSGAVPFSSFGTQYDFPQGRNITQYQAIDDFTLVRGEHAFKFGINFRRYDTSDHNFFFTNPAVYFGYVSAGLQNFANGLAYQYRRSLNVSSDVPVAMWGSGFYAQDEWRVRSNLKLTLALRAERNSNPVCQVNCFANFVSPWSSLPSYVAGANSGTIAYNKDIVTGLHSAYSGVDSVNWAPRVGFRWSPKGDNSLAISGGYGIFYDNPPEGLVDDELGDPPVAVALRVRPSKGTLAFDTTAAGSAATWQASANAFSSGFSGGQTYGQISKTLSGLGVVFAAPAFTALSGTIHAPLWQEWNLQVQKQFGTATVLSLNYVGNQGQRIPYSNAWPNAWDEYQIYCSGLCTTGLIPLSPPVANYGTVTTVQSGAISSYNGLTIMLRERFSHWFTAHLNYTWSHNLDEDSNGGLFTIGDGFQSQTCPYGLRACNWGNSDYDIRHFFSADYVMNPEFKVNSSFAKQVVNGWQFSGKIFWRTGLPFSVTDGNLSGAIGNGGGTFMAIPINHLEGQVSCSGKDATATSNPIVSSCLNPNAFVNTGAASWTNYTTFPGQDRNQYVGPHFFDADMSLYKNFSIREHMKLGIGAQAFNVFNHPNFANPNNSLLAGDTTFGQISGMVGVPTSPYGVFLGFDSSPRVVQLSAKLEF